MALRGKKPEAIKKRLKAFFYGTAGVGKTTAAIKFPKPYVIDTERGAENDEYVKIMKKNNAAIFQTTDFDELLEEVRQLLTTKHSYQTLIIDPLTTLYFDLCEKWAKRLANKSKDSDSDGTEFNRHRDKAGTEIMHLFKLLLRLDMNVIITSHQKDKWERIGGESQQTGVTFDCYKKMDYLFDVVFEIQKQGKDKRIGIVKKTRIAEFPDGEVIPFDYDEIAKRYGREVLERDAIPVKLATQQQIDDINQLVALLKIEQELVEKWLHKADAETFSEMTTEDIQKCIDFLKEKLPKAVANG